jgi:hypothetical protein
MTGVPAGWPVFPAANDSESDPAVFTGQTYVVARNENGHLQTTVFEGVRPKNRDETLRCIELGSRRDVATFDSESVYLLAWQRPSVTATLTGLRGGTILGSIVVEVAQDPTQVKVDWSAIDALAISCSSSGTAGFPVKNNFLLLSLPFMTPVPAAPLLSVLTDLASLL